METPLRTNELKVIALLSGMLREFRLINSDTPLDDMHNLICKTATEVLDVCESQNTPTSSEECATPAVSKCEGLQGRELLLAYAEWRERFDLLIRQKPESLVDEFLSQQ